MPNVVYEKISVEKMRDFASPASNTAALIHEEAEGLWAWMKEQKIDTGTEIWVGAVGLLDRVQTNLTSILQEFREARDRAKLAVKMGKSLSSEKAPNGRTEKADKGASAKPKRKAKTVT